MIIFILLIILLIFIFYFFPLLFSMKMSRSEDKKDFNVNKNLELFAMMRARIFRTKLSPRSARESWVICTKLRGADLFAFLRSEQPL